MINEAVILAGGFGTRLRGIIDDLPKPMAPVRGRPFIEWLLNHLRHNGIEKTVIASGYLHETISSYFGKAYREMAIEYSVENEPLGTGGAVLMAAGKIKGENFFLLNGDTFFDVGLNSFYEFFISYPAVLSVALKPVENAGRYGMVKLEGNRISSFSEKTNENRGLINGGVYIINRGWFDRNAPGIRFSLEKDILEKKVGEDVITGYPCDSYFIDIGIPDDYRRAWEELHAPEP